MQHLEKQPHIQLTKKDVRPVVVVVGDPARAAIVAGMCERSREMTFNREYRSFDCCQAAMKFTVISHGVGASGCAVCFEELIECGAKVIIRAGTCGSLQPDVIKQGDVVICHAACREDGVTALFAPDGFPAVADPCVLSALERCAEDHGTGTKHGITLTSDLFYQSPVLPTKLTLWQKAGVEVTEMEAATLFVIARIRGIRAGCVCAVDGSPLQWGEGDYDPTGAKAAQGKKNMLEIAIKTAVRLTSNYKK